MNHLKKAMLGGLLVAACFACNKKINKAATGVADSGGSGDICDPDAALLSLTKNKVNRNDLTNPNYITNKAHLSFENGSPTISVNTSDVMLPKQTASLAESDPDDPGIVVRSVFFRYYFTLGTDSSSTPNPDAFQGPTLVDHNLVIPPNILQRAGTTDVILHLGTCISQASSTDTPEDSWEIAHHMVCSPFKNYRFSSSEIPLGTVDTGNLARVEQVKREFINYIQDLFAKHNIANLVDPVESAQNMLNGAIFAFNEEFGFLQAMQNPKLALAESCDIDIPSFGDSGSLFPTPSGPTGSGSSTGSTTSETTGSSATTGAVAEAGASGETGDPFTFEPPASNNANVTTGAVLLTVGLIVLGITIVKFIRPWARNYKANRAIMLSAGKIDDLLTATEKLRTQYFEDVKANKPTALQEFTDKLDAEKKKFLGDVSDIIDPKDPKVSPPDFKTALEARAKNIVDNLNINRKLDKNGATSLNEASKVLDKPGQPGRAPLQGQLLIESLTSGGMDPTSFEVASLTDAANDKLPKNFSDASGGHVELTRPSNAVTKRFFVGNIKVKSGAGFVSSAFKSPKSAIAAAILGVAVAVGGGKIMASLAHSTTASKTISFNFTKEEVETITNYIEKYQALNP